MKIALVGFDTEGRASYDYFIKQDHQITVHDQDPDCDVPEGVERVLGEHYLDYLGRYDLIVRTAGLHPQKILDKNPEVADKITTHINEFFRVCLTPNIIGVTGTKGKGTTSTLITKMLEAQGKQVQLGGNIGLPPLTFLDKIRQDSWVVLELSSFQLIDLQYSPPLAVCLMVVPEHLNWHASLEEYITAKSQLFAHQTSEDTAVYFAENEVSQRICEAGLGQTIPYFAAPGAEVVDGAIVIDDQEICKTDELKLLGAHNWQNACAAVTALWQVSQDVSALRRVLTSFSGLEHRLEFVREVDGVRYYDDSFGTAPETAIVALQAFSEPKVIILGGSDKGVSFDELAKVVKASNVRHVVLVGDTAAQIASALTAAGFTNFSDGYTTMSAMVRACREHALPGDVVLLSTACASFGLFQNYKDRGNQFKDTVQKLV